MDEQNTVQFVGPLEGNRYMVSIGGYRIPNFHAELRQGTEDGEGEWALVLSRYGASFHVTSWIPEKWLRVILPVLADAMAISAGYSAFGENSIPLNPYRSKLSPLPIVGMEAGDVD